MARPTNKKNRAVKNIKAGACDPEHDFILILSDVPALTSEVENALFESGCDDGTVGMHAGRMSLDFTRSAPTLKDAILSAIQDVHKAKIGARIVRVDNCDLVTQAEIARKISRTRQLVHQYINGTRGPGGFPPPVCEITDGIPLWQWCEVAYWLGENDMITEDVVRAARDTEMINTVLQFVNQQLLHPDLMAEILAHFPEFVAQVVSDASKLNEAGAASSGNRPLTRQS
jgi:hypothetical protein